MGTEAVAYPLIRGAGRPRARSGFEWNRNLLDETPVRWAPGCVHLYQPGRMENRLMPVMTTQQFLEYARAGSHLINAAVLDYVHDRPELYFEEWRPLIDGKFRTVLFCGSIFFDGHGVEAIEALQWDPEMKRLERVMRRMNDTLHHNCFAASIHLY